MLRFNFQHDFLGKKRFQQKVAQNFEENLKTAVTLTNLSIQLCQFYA